jgi:hypothetical protein
MASQARESHFHRPLVRHSERISDWLDSETDFADDTLLVIAYAISEGAITFVGPFFWMCLVALLLIAELGA